ncbi:MAG: DUF2207 domain-containing protein [Devosiaceae bacterium]|nr:DUF2207 domain-containing protein [Devosiaceae bacterium]
MFPLIKSLQKLIFSKILLLIGLLVFSLPSFAQEVINSYSTNITINIDGSVEIVEYIEVRAEGNKIKRGIFRDVATIMKNDDGSDFRSELEIISIKKNGQDEPFSTKKITNGLRIYIGEASVFLEPGNYRYMIKYSMTRQVRFFETHDELFFNVIGHFWDFPIKQAVARIKLPDGAIISDLVGYTGATGSTEQALTITKTSNNSAAFQATRSLNSYEGMSIAVKFQKGIIAEPAGIKETALYLSDRRDIIVPISGAFLVLFYYLYAWNKIGRDPKKGTIIPLFYPPKGFSPALIHYIWKMGWKKNGWTAYSAALLNLAIKGLITIDKKKNSTKIDLTNKPARYLPSGEQIIYDYIQSKGTVFFNKAHGVKLNKTREEFIKIIGTENRHAFFKNNVSYVIIGFVLSAISLIIMMVLGIIHPVYAVGAIGAGVAIALLTGAFSGLWSRGGFARIFIFVWIAMAGFNMSGAILATFATISSTTAIIATVTIVILNVLFAFLMRAPTVHGRKIMDQIDGFRMYLEVAEKQRLNMIDEPEMSVKRFEKILPFAVALGVEKPWSQHFESELARNAVSDATNNYNPTWLSGTSYSASSLSKSMSGLATGMSASMIAAQPSSSSSSGFSSGGSSGGGGGGGGGGGW